MTNTTDTMTSEAWDRLVRATRWAIADAQRPERGTEDDLPAVPEADSEVALPAWDQTVWAEGFITGPLADLPRFGPEEGWTRYVPITCPSAMCMAGNGAFLLGGQFVVGEHDAQSWEPGDEPISSSSVVIGNEPDAPIEDVNVVGARSFGLDPTESFHLFDGDHDLTTTVSIVHAIGNHHGRHLPAELAEYASPEFIDAMTERIYG